MLTGRIAKQEGVWWSAEVPLAGVNTQGKSRSDAMAMMADALEALVNRPGFRVTVSAHGADGEVLVEASDSAALAAYVLRYQRETHGLSLADVAKALGSSSKNAYARYEQGQSVPALDKFSELLHAVAPELVLVLESRRPPRSAGSKGVSTAAEQPARTRTPRRKA